MYSLNPLVLQLRVKGTQKMGEEEVTSKNRFDKIFTMFLIHIYWRTT